MEQRSEKLQNQFNIILGEPDAEQKLQSLTHLLSKNNHLSEYAEFLRKFPDFFDAVEESYLLYEGKDKYKLHKLELGSEEIGKANQELEELNRTIHAMLDGFGYGLLFFNNTGICSPVYSKACLTLLETNPSGRHIADVLKIAEEERKDITDWIALMFSGNTAMSFDDLLEIAPNSYKHSAGLFIKLDYKPLLDCNGKLKDILLIASDHTKEQQAKIRVLENENKALRTLRIARNRNYFLRFVAQFREIFMENDFMDEEFLKNNFDQFKRDVHTIKGLSASFHLSELTDILHSFETDLNNLSGSRDVQEILIGYYYKLNENFNVSLQFAKEVLGTDFENTGSVVNVQTKKILGFSQDIKQKLEQGASPEDISQMLLKELIAVPIREVFANFDMQLQELADRAGKMVNHCLFLGENFVILSEKYEGVITSLGHIARNIIDHAIDEPEIRKQFGKLPKGYITVGTERKDDRFTITITDDGNGIDIDVLRLKLSDCIGDVALAAMSDDEIIQHIFDDNLSTMDTITETSGRGVGMSAVKAEVEKLGGNIYVQSTIGKGTSVHITLPFIWN